MTDQNTRSILVKFKDGSWRRISSIPEKAKITYAKVNPSAAGIPTGGDVPYALRIYRTANDQIAVFLGVVEFRDLSIDVEVREVPKPVLDPITHQVIEPEGKVSWKPEVA